MIIQVVMKLKAQWGLHAHITVSYTHLISLYEDRIEFTSIGGLVSGVDVYKRQVQKALILRAFCLSLYFVYTLFS